PAQPRLECQQPGQRRTGHGGERDIALIQVRDDAVVAVRPEGTAAATHIGVGSEHEVVNDELTASCKQVRQSLSPGGAFEYVGAGYAFPGQLAPLATELVTQAHELLLFRQKPAAGLDPFVAGHDRLMTVHTLGSSAY